MTIQAYGTHKYHGKTPRDRMIEGEQMLADRNAGMQASALMEKYGVSRATLDRRLKEAIEQRVAVTVDAYRAAQDALLDRLMEEAEKSLLVADAIVQSGIENKFFPDIERGMRMRESWQAQVLKIAERRAKLMGLDMPTRVDATVTHVTQEDLELAEMVREAKARESAPANSVDPA
jgi:hypothetical protein